MTDKWEEHAADFKAPEVLEEELEEDGLSIKDAEAEHFGED